MRSRLSTAVLAVLVTCFLVIDTPVYADLNSGLVAYYPLNGNVNDASASGSNATIHNFPTFVPGVSGQGLHFQGVGHTGTSGDWVGLPYINFQSMSSFTISLWANVQGDSSPYGHGEGLIFFGHHNYGCVAILYNPDSPAGTYHLDFGAGSAWVSSATGALQYNQWRLFTLVYTASQIRGYVDGQLIGSGAGSVSQAITNAGMGIHWFSDGVSTRFIGVLDDVRIYNHALSASEIQQLYLGNGGGSPIVSNVRPTQRAGTKQVDISYDLTNPQGSPLAVSVTVSTNNGTSFDLPASSFTPANGSSITPGNSRQVTWNAGADWNNRSSSQVKFRITASSTITADSGSITVNTMDDGNRPVVQDVTSAYCGAGKHAYFLNGVSLSQTFTANINWNGKTSGSIKFISPTGTVTGGTQTYNVGTGFGVGGTLAVKAVASDGTESLPYPVNFDVAAPPPLLTASDLAFSQGKYVVQTKPQWQVLNEGTSSVPKDDSGQDIPGCTGKPLSFATTLILGGEIPVDGTWSTGLSLEQSLRKFDLLGLEIEPSVSGGISGSLGPQGWSLDGSLGLGISTSWETPPFPLWAVPPIYGKFGLEVAQSIEGHIIYDSERGLYPSGKFPGHVYLDFIAGLGIDGITDVEAFVGGGPYWQFQWPQLPVLDEWGIELHGGIRYLVFIYKGEWSLEYTWIGRAGEPAMLVAGTESKLKRPPTSQFTLMSRDYLTTPTGKARLALGEAATENALSGIMSGTVNALTNNVFPYSQPQLGVGGTNRFLAWIADTGLVRSNENRTILVSQRWNETSWSNPTPVWDEATADFAPSLVAFADGTALVAWQNEKSVLPDGATLDQALAGFEIAAARYNPVTGVWTPTNLTDNSYLDRSPQLAAAANGKALLTWVSNAGNDPLGSTATQNVVHARLWTGSSWNSDAVIAGNAPVLLWSTVAFDGTNGVFLAVVDADDDESTGDDQELYGATFDGAAWSALARLTTNTVQDTKPQAVYDSTGTLIVAWYQGSNVVVHAGDLNLSSPIVAGTLAGTSSSKDFRLVTGPAGQVSMVWEDLAADGTGPDPFLLNWDATLGVWSQPVRLLTNTNQLERSFSAAYSPTGSLLMAYNRVAVSYDTNNVPQFGQVDLMFMDYLIGSDLATYNSDVSLSTNAVPGQPVNILAFVRNSGELAATNVAVKFYDGNPSNNVQIGSTQIVPGTLPAGSNATVQVTWTVPNTTSNRTVYVVVDPALAQEDRNRANNTASLSVLAPDLQISDMTVLQPNVTNRVINARCVNTGTIPSGSAADVVFHRGSTTGTVLATVPIGILLTNGAYDASFEWNMSGLTFTSAFELVYAVIDPDGIVSEADKGNNSRMVSVMTTLDTDGDGLLDGEEAHYGTDPLLADTDGDGLSDGAEIHVYGTNPTKGDTDGDGIPDGWEVVHGLDPLQPSDASLDVDGDGMSNVQEYLAGTDPKDASSALRITSIKRVGTDVQVFFTSISGKQYSLRRYSSVGGAWTDIVTNIPGGNGIQWVKDIGGASLGSAYYRIQLSQGTNAPPADSDGDGVPDFWVQQYFGHPTGLASDRSCATCDADGTGQNNLFKYWAGLNPTNPASVFRIISLTPQGSNMKIGWQAGGGRTNVVQASSVFGTNNFNDISTPLALLGSGDVFTNWVDNGGATNSLTRLYRIRLAQ